MTDREPDRQTVTVCEYTIRMGEKGLQYWDSTLAGWYSIVKIGGQYLADEAIRALLDERARLEAMEQEIRGLFEAASLACERLASIRFIQTGDDKNLLWNSCSE